MRKINNIILIIFCTNIFIINNINAQWFNENSLNSTIAIEVKEDSLFKPHGTGFLLWNYENEGNPIVITAGHVLSEILAKGFNEIYISVNIGSELEEYVIESNMEKDSIWFENKNFLWKISEGKLRTKIIFQNKPNANYIINASKDIGAFLIEISTWVTILKTGKKFVTTKTIMLPNSSIGYKNNVKLGDDVFFVGFPRGLGIDVQIQPIIRDGIISWKTENSNLFIIDAIALGGNSGSPVFTKRTEYSDIKLIGMVTGAWFDTLNIIIQPDPSKREYYKKDIRVLNWGLTKCVWIDDILDVRNKVIELDIVKNY